MEPLSWLSGNRELKRGISMDSLIVLKYRLAEDVEFSGILKRKERNCTLPRKTPPLSLCAGFHTRKTNPEFGLCFHSCTREIK